MTNVKKLSEIEAKFPMRNKTWFKDLDYIYGRNTLEESPHNIGMPKGKISLWAGQSGVGKSRLCIEVAKKFSTNYNNGRVLYFQTESPLSDFASWAKDTKQYDNIYCSGENRIDEMIKIIYEVKPKLIFIDSVNEIDEFENGNKKEARRIIQGADGKVGLKIATHFVGAHTILLGQLNQDGKTIKGGTSLPHLVDIALNVVKTDTAGIFRVEVGTKHRYGSTEPIAMFKHTDDGVVEHDIVLQENVPDAPVYDFNAPNPNNEHGWSDAQLANYEKTKAEWAASGKIKLDSDGEVMPNDNRSLLTKLNQGVGNFFGLK
jgi:predicted ATP-dependent serine protease